MAALNVIYELTQQRERDGADLGRLERLQKRVAAAVSAGPTTGVDAPEESV
jgi:hypothetical protein